MKSEIQMLEHFEVHKSQDESSSRDQETIKTTKIEKTSRVDTKKIFGQERFENLVSKKVSSINDVEDAVDQRNFIEQIKKMVPKSPFLYAPYFIDDLFNGMSSKELSEKHSVSTPVDLQNIVQKTLQLDGYRHTKNQRYDAHEMNLKNSTWKEKYQIFKDNCEYFQDELAQLLFYNMLSSYIVLIMMDHLKEGLSRKDIIANSRDLKNHFELFKIVDSSLKNKFESYFIESFEDNMNEVIDELVNEKILHKKYEKPNVLFGTLSIDKIREEIINELRYNPNIKSKGQIKANITMKNQSIRILRGIDVFDTAINELESEQIICQQYGSNKRNTSLVFLQDNYDKMQGKLDELDPSTIPFRGRNISPDDFIEELQYLDKGDFGDDDDQVTRIAGLVLVESAKLQPPHEKIEEFDFSIDLSNYNFSPDQLNAIKKLDFVINSNIFHCKVMLDDKLILEEYQKIKSNLPSGDQGMVITFEEIPTEMKEILQNDKSIQVIDKEGLKVWASITPTIPSRKNSVARIYFDPISNIENRLVKVNLINYESGLASVSLIPDMKEITVLIRSLEEIPLYDKHPMNFESFASRYVEFLNIIAKLSTFESFNRGLLETNMANISITNSTSLITADLDGDKVCLNLDKQSALDMFQCKCISWQEDKLNLCPHLIHLLDKIIREHSSLYLDDRWYDGSNPLRHALTSLIEHNISIVLDRLEIGVENEDTELYKKMKRFVFATQTRET